MNLEDKIIIIVDLFVDFLITYFQVKYWKVLLFRPQKLIIKTKKTTKKRPEKNLNFVKLLLDKTSL